MSSRSFPRLPEAEEMAKDLPDLSQDEILRYSRHLIIPDVGDRKSVV